MDKLDKLSDNVSIMVHKSELLPFYLGNAEEAEQSEWKQERHSLVINLSVLKF